MKLYGKHTEEVANRIIEVFKHPERLPRALAPIFIHRNDDVPCRKWSYYNQLLLALSGSVDARGIAQWRKAGRRIKKGCKAIWILAPCIKKIKEEKGDDEKERQIVYGFRSVPVFAIEDTVGDDLPESDDKYDQWVKELPLIEVAESWEINVDTYSFDGGNPLGYYRYRGDGRKAIMLGTECLSTFAHELTHAADHKLTGLKGDKCRKEVVAELGSAVLLTCLGKEYDADLGGAYEYIERYAGSAGKTPLKACTQVLSDVCNSVKLILDTAQALDATPKVA